MVWWVGPATVRGYSVGCGMDCVGKGGENTMPRFRDASLRGNHAKIVCQLVKAGLTFKNCAEKKMRTGY